MSENIGFYPAERVNSSRTEAAQGAATNPKAAHASSSPLVRSMQADSQTQRTEQEQQKQQKQQQSIQAVGGGESAAAVADARQR